MKVWSNDDDYPCLSCRHQKTKSTLEPCKGCLIQEEHPDTGKPNVARGWEKI